MVLRSVDNSDYEAIEKDIRDVLNLGGRDIQVSPQMQRDEMGFRWIVLTGPKLEDAITALHLIADLVKQGGYGDSLLAAMFAFGSLGQRWYLIYNYRRAQFYPFAPRGYQQRDDSREFRIRQTLANALPIEKDPERWYPLWDPPFA